MVFHVLNRGVGQMRLCDDDDDYAAFERVLTETLEIQPMRVCAYCVKLSDRNILRQEN